ncbi:MAG: mechanosensitive ion channel family protein [Candidatus Omnitrophica bacterium]|nr:mechanosensitive ion channel family protein [Candidatus Omnitrophota bacterium]MBU1925986.1 mechanosensitive ion channel family protein [Candidatus Omnitrophota bacterium]
MFAKILQAEILQKVYLGNKVLDYFIALGIFLVSIGALTAIKNIAISRLKKWAGKTATILNVFIIRVLRHNLLPLLYFSAIFLAAQHLILAASVKKALDVLGVIVVTVMSMKFLVNLINYMLLAWLKSETSEARQRSLKGVVGVFKVVVWGVGVVFLLDNLGFKVSTVLAGLGIGGVAVALAAQALLGDLFSYFAIMFDRPFEVGDFIIIGDYMGAVEYIGIKTTRIRSLGGEQLIFSNTDLTNSRVRNYKRMEKRRVMFRLGVVYQTPYEKLKEIPELIKNIVENVKDTGFDRAHFFEFAGFNLVIEIVYYVIGADYNKYMNIQQEINLMIKKEFEKKGIEFAYPTQTLYVNKES